MSAVEILDAGLPERPSDRRPGSTPPPPFERTLRPLVSRPVASRRNLGGGAGRRHHCWLQRIGAANRVCNRPPSPTIHAALRTDDGSLAELTFLAPSRETAEAGSGNGVQNLDDRLRRTLFGCRHIRRPYTRSCALIAGALLACMALPLARAQQIEKGVAIVAEKIASRVDGFSYRPNTSSELDFRGTNLAPRVVGSVRVRTGNGRTELNARIEHLPDPWTLGPLAVYILWVITPEGRATNVGMVDLDGEHGRIETATPLSSFALIVTAEPHFAVSVPGQQVVAQNVGTNVKGAPLSVTSLAARADYSGLKPAARDPKRPVPIELEMARYALAIAQSADAPTAATGAYDRAKAALQTAETAFTTRKSYDRAAVSEAAREAIQSAEDARAAAEIRRSSTEMNNLREQLAAGERAGSEARASGQIAQAEAIDARARLKALENRQPTAASRLRLANELVVRWLQTEVLDSGLVSHVPPDDFLKGKPEMTPASRDRLSIAVGVLIGIGGFSVTVSPALQISEDVRQLGLAQQRARTLMEWLSSLGIHATVGVPPPSAAAEAALSTGPGVDLLIYAQDSGASNPEASAAAIPSN